MKTKLIGTLVLLCASTMAFAGPRVRVGVGFGFEGFIRAMAITAASRPTIRPRPHITRPHRHITLRRLPAMSGWAADIIPPMPGYAWRGGYWARPPYAGASWVGSRFVGGPLLRGHWRR